MHVVDAGDVRQPVVAEIDDVRRFERDPVDVWGSLGGDHLYVRRVDDRSLVQINTRSSDLVEISLDQALTYGNFDVLSEMILSDHARLIGESNSRSENSLLRLLLGENYRARYGYHPLTVTLLDFSRTNHSRG